jgi:hypothetical protein
MKSRAALVFGLLCLVVAAACGKKAKSGDDDDDSRGGSGGTAGAGGAQAGSGGSASGGKAGGAGLAGAAAGPAITTAPPAWVPPAECGGIGERCADLLGCGSLSVCQLEGNVCIPALPPGATALPGRTPEHPYCAAYTCMTFEEASCFCTGEAATVTPNCSSPSALAGLCTGPGGSCASKACCEGSSCVDSGSAKLCLEVCSSASDCSTGCCTDLYETGVTSCAEPDACTNPCKKTGEACAPGSSTTPDDCCRGSCVESENPDYAGCRPTCTTSADCADTGCCVPFSNSTSGFCAAAVYCSCSAEGSACGADPPYCCEGSICAGTSAEDLACFRVCTTDADCPTQNCRPLSDGSQSICEAACAPLGGRCSSAEGLYCCDDMTCAGTVGEDYHCYLPCESDADCPEGSCEFIDETHGICN